MDTTIYASEGTAITDPIVMQNLGRLFSNAYVSFEFSMTNRFRKDDLVLPLSGTVLLEASENGVYWGKALTSAGGSNAGTISLGSATGDFERVSFGGIVEEMKFTPTAIGVALFWRAIVQRS